MVSIEDLKKDIAERKKKLIKAKEKEILRLQKRELQRELITIKSRRVIAAGQKAKRILGKAGTGLLKAGKKIAPILKKQARLIRDQQLRDDAIARKLERRKTAPTVIKKVITVRKKKGKKTKVKVKVKKTKPRKQKKVAGNDLFTSLDF